jgi:hypothetical protein
MIIHKKQTTAALTKDAGKIVKSRNMNKSETNRCWFESDYITEHLNPRM